MTSLEDAGQQDPRFARGLERLTELDNSGTAQRLLDNVRDVSPRLARYVIEFAFGDIFSAPDLDVQQRVLITIGVLTALGGAESQLPVHINMGLDAGLSKEQIAGAMLQCTPYAGFPRVLNATSVAKRVFAERNAAD